MEAEARGAASLRLKDAVDEMRQIRKGRSMRLSFMRRMVPNLQLQSAPKTSEVEMFGDKSQLWNSVSKFRWALSCN